MDKFNDRSERDMLIALVTAGPGTEDQQHRPKALAAARDNVLRNLVDQHYVRMKTLLDNMVDLCHIRSAQVENRLQRMPLLCWLNCRCFFRVQ